MTDTLDDLNREVLRQPDGQIATMDFWNAGSKGNGLGFKAYKQSLAWLTEIVSRDGLIAKLNDSITFLTRNVRDN